MRALKWSGYVGLVALVALATSASQASAGKIDARSILISQFHLESSNGYRLEGFTFAGLVFLSASSGHVSATYLVQGRIAGGRIKARFGDLGRIALAFRTPRLGDNAKRDQCDLEQHGEFRGTIEFRGENGYTEVDVDRAEGKVLAFPEAPACLRPRRPMTARASGLFQLPERKSTTRLFAISKRHGRIASVNALGFPGRDRIRVEASLEEKRGEMAIGRRATALVGGRSSFASSGVGKHPAFAFLAPPKPFSGGATFQELDDSASSWTGDLSAWLPGVGRTSFAGPTYASELCRRRGKSASCPPSPTVRRPLVELLQDSGSQSQAPGEARLSWSR